MVKNFTQISVTDFKNELETGKYTLIDCRTPEEWDIYGKISDTQILIDVNSPTSQFQIQKLDKKLPYLVYCWHGNRSATLREYMKEQWFEFVCDLEWGIDLWNNY